MIPTDKKWKQYAQTFERKVLNYVLKEVYFLFQGYFCFGKRLLLGANLSHINPLKTKRRPLYLKTQSVPRCKHFLFRL
jgi:hypothetical protein